MSFNRFKRTHAQQDRDRGEIVRLYCQGHTQEKVAELMRQRFYAERPEGWFSRQMVRTAWGQALTEWRDKYLEDLDKNRTRELLKIDALEQEAWAAWERSVGMIEITTKKSRGEKLGKEGETGKVIGESVTKTEIQNGDPRYLQTVQWCIDKRCAILGVNAPLQIQADVASWLDVGTLAKLHTGTSSGTD